MITLQLQNYSSPERGHDATRIRDVTFESVHRLFSEALEDLTTLSEQERQRTIEIPADLLFHSVATLFPPERMAVIAGRRNFGRTTLGASYDVTSTGLRTHHAHVEADPEKLRRALIGFELAGVELAAWIHSHPGSGPIATFPSDIDREQYSDWTRDFSGGLIGMIVVADGFVRLWGDGIECGLVRAEVTGKGVHPVGGLRYVYQLDR